MKTFGQLTEQLFSEADSSTSSLAQLAEAAAANAAANKLKSKPIDSDMSFVHHEKGKLTGKFKGMKNMGGKTYASIEVKGHGKTYVPPHQVIHEDTQED